MYKDYPDRPITVLVNVTSAPKLDFTGDRATVTSDASFAFTVADNATRPRPTDRPAFTLACTLGIGVNVSMVRFGPAQQSVPLPTACVLMAQVTPADDCLVACFSVVHSAGRANISSSL
jgi:hypothetical protein